MNGDVWEQFAVLGTLIGSVIVLDLLSEFVFEIDFITLWPLRWLVYLVMLTLLAVMGARGQDEFIYFQF